MNFTAPQLLHGETGGRPHPSPAAQPIRKRWLELMKIALPDDATGSRKRQRVEAANRLAKKLGKIEESGGGFWVFAPPKEKGR